MLCWMRGSRFQGEETGFYAGCLDEVSLTHPRPCCFSPYWPPPPLPQRHPPRPRPLPQGRRPAAERAGLHRVDDAVGRQAGADGGLPLRRLAPLRRAHVSRARGGGRDGAQGVGAWGWGRGRAAALLLLVSALCALPLLPLPPLSPHPADQSCASSLPLCTLLLPLLLLPPATRTQGQERHAHPRVPAAAARPDAAAGHHRGAQPGAQLR